MRALASAPFGALIVSSAAERGEEDGRLRPTSAAQSGRRRRAGHVDLLHQQAGCDGGDRGRDACRAHDPHDAGAVGTDAGGHRWSLRAEPHDVLPAGQHPHRPSVVVGQVDGRPPATGWLACPRRPRRWRAGVAGSPPGRAPGAVGLEVARLHPGRAQRPGPVARRNLDGPRERHRRPAALHLARRRPRLGERLAHDPRTVGGAHRHEGVGRSGVVGEAALAEGDARSHQLRACHPRARLAGRRRRGLARRCPWASRPRRRRTPPRSCCQPVQRQRWASSAWSTSARLAAGSLAREGGQPHDDPRRAEPALARRPSRRTPRPTAPARQGRGPRPWSPSGRRHGAPA